MECALKPYGEFGFLAQRLSERDRLTVLAAARVELPPGCLESIAGFDSVLFVFAKPTPAKVLELWLRRAEIDVVESVSKKSVLEVPVTYDGADLELVAGHTGLTVSAIIKLHSAPVYTVRMMGFTPGFPYLDGLDERLQIPRKASPRIRIDPGSVAIGGPHAGIYSVASPGGWHLLGCTELRLFNSEAAREQKWDFEKVFLLEPGDRLRFKPIDHAH